MKAIDVVSLVSLGLIFYLILGEGAFKAGPSKTPDIESKFEQGLSREYVPDPGLFTSRDKLLADLNYRQQRMKYAMEDEIKEYDSLPGTREEKKAGYEALKARHAAAENELVRRHNELLDSYKQNERADEINNQGLR